jgi:putative aldouronate transport system permease protein
VTRILRRWPEALIILFLAVAALACLLPLVHELMMAISSNDAVVSRTVGFVPVEPTLNSFREVFRDPSVLQSLVFSIYLTAAFTVIAMVLTIAAAYPLTRPELKGRKFFTMVIVITMYFSGGILPLYIPSRCSACSTRCGR